MKNMALDISFTVLTENDFEHVTKDEVYQGILRRLAVLMKNWEPEAIGYIDEYEVSKTDEIEFLEFKIRQLKKEEINETC